MATTTKIQDRITKEIELKAPVERVWRALTNHEEFGKWFGAKLDGPFAVGEVSRGVINGCGSAEHKWEATVVAMDEPRLFAYTWHPYAVEPGRDYSGEPTTRVEFTLEPSAAGTRLTVTESGFAALPADRAAEAMPKHDGGWVAQLRNIQAYVEA